ncbi:hypothetical protein [Gimesia aquarii]|uniref:hypothetical protein n=1 Tax=Gimesia aquarii TaxID=2527964 RepID=UPI0018D69542|nr:hypothetical protein [Gimesia aquarii]
MPPKVTDLVGVDPPHDIPTDSHPHRQHAKPSACLNANTSTPRADTWISLYIDHRSPMR